MVFQLSFRNTLLSKWLLPVLLLLGGSLSAQQPNARVHGQIANMADGKPVLLRYWHYIQADYDTLARTAVDAEGRYALDVHLKTAGYYKFHAE